MRIPLYQVDAFASEVFSGNPAAVCPLDKWLDDAKLQAIAAENNLSETAFFVPNTNGGFDLRWFTPLTEVALCGHATLASAFVIFEFMKWPQEMICFDTRKSGRLSVKRAKDLFELDFPALPAVSQEPSPNLHRALGARYEDVLRSEEDLLVILSSEDEVRKLTPDFVALERIECRGIIVSSRGRSCDFVSRFFAPRVGIPEDPVTGSAHCVLVPYWAERLSKADLYALQVSKRGGEIFCRNLGKRVGIAGRAVLYLHGTIVID